MNLICLISIIGSSCRTTFYSAVEAVHPQELSEWIGKVGSKYSVYYQKIHRGSGQLLQERFGTILIQKKGYLSKLGRYTECNPTRAEMEGIHYLWDYKWSSARKFCLDEVDPLLNKRKYFWGTKWGNLKKIGRKMK